MSDEMLLIPLIKKYILSGSIISDEWAAYRKVAEYGYVHKTINQSEHFWTATIQISTFKRRKVVHLEKNYQHLDSEAKAWLKWCP